MNGPARETIAHKVRSDARMWARAWRRELTLLLFFRLLLLEPGFQLAFSLRLMELGARVPVLGKLLRRLVWYATVRSFGCDIGVEVRAGGGLYFPHPFAIVIHSHAQIGPNVTLLQNVTLGIVDAANPGCPVLEQGAWINAGAKVLGPVTIGSNAVVGANAVVLSNVPADSVAVGVPARILPKKRALAASG
jgi:serine O-acetyltransferase